MERQCSHPHHERPPAVSPAGEKCMQMLCLLTQGAEWVVWFDHNLAYFTIRETGRSRSGGYWITWVARMSMVLGS